MFFLALNRKKNETRRIKLCIQGVEDDPFVRFKLSIAHNLYAKISLTFSLNSIICIVFVVYCYYFYCTKYRLRKNSTLSDDATVGHTANRCFFFLVVYV